MDFRGKKYERGSNWSDPEVVELLQLWADDSVQIELESCLRNQHVFNRIAEVLREKGILRTGDQCREKIKKMKLEYRRIKDNQKTVRGGRTWKFYEVMDRVLTNRPSVSYSSLGGTVIAHQVLQGTPGSEAFHLHNIPAAAFGSPSSGTLLFGHPPKPGDLLEIKCEDVDSDDGLLNSDPPPPELLYQTNSGEEPDADSKSLGLDQEDLVEMGRGEGVANSGFSPSGFSDQNMATSSGTGGSTVAAPAVDVGGGRVAEERLLSLEEARLEREAEAEERRERMEQRRAEQDRQHELRLFTVFATALSAVHGGPRPAPSPTAPAPATSSSPNPAEPQGETRKDPDSRPTQSSVYLSARGNHFCQHKGILQEGYALYHGNKHDATSNPDGIINLGTSENKLCYDLLSKRLTQVDMLHVDPALLEYPDWKGHRFLREEVASFLTQYCNSPCPLRAENVVVMNGCGSLFSAIAAVICDPGDAILVPTPFYGVIKENVGLYSGVRLVHTHLDCQVSGSEESPFQLTVEKLEKSLQQAKAEGVRVRAVILVNPHNPLAVIYSAQQMTAFLEFAKRHELHAIVDEVYMLTVFGESASFSSVLSHSRLPDAQRTHVLWGISKDFALSGLRMGVVYSQNREFVAALDQVGSFHGVSGTNQHQVAQLLRDRDWISGEFLPQNHARLRAAHRYVTGELKDMGIPYLHSQACFYVWADFRKVLPEQSFEAERKLWRRFLKHRILISCGAAFSCATPGWFRIVFTDQELRLQLGMQRLRKALEEVGWECGSPRQGAHPEVGGMENGDRGHSLTTTDEAEPKQDSPAPGDSAAALSLAGNEFITLDCQTTSQNSTGSSLDSLIGTLRQQIRSSDWLEKNTPELSAGEDPELLEVFRDLLQRARK
ncbi:hypothetical protein AGOR_G00001420 [Albula goreensis]|uniref:1-aminocyclopropane-1-carboxylate synthase-like protein 1 n=1 Tax=Albula goreensis TaxID=1534307 RepID=A0A8T3E483_9TELE|nr:hypothetical protein AGOR_G00001420 [Albula goreensis]